jgi:hypothetical protein
VPQSIYIDLLETHRILLHNTFLPLAAEATAVPGFGRDHWEIIRRYRNMAALVVHLPDRGSGRVTLGHDRRIKIGYRLDRGEIRWLTAGIVLAARILFAAGADLVLLPIRFREIAHHAGDLEAIEPDRTVASHLKLAAFHPHGTCRMGTDPRSSVVDDSFRVHGLEGLYVADASVIPCALDVGPQLTVMAMASRAAERIVARI